MITSGAVRRRSPASSSRVPASATRTMPGSERSSVAIARRPAPGTSAYSTRTLGSVTAPA